MLKILHTSDWHLGHSLHDLPRDSEHAAFLNWLLEQLVEHNIDALLIAGDIFDTANPPSRAMRTWFHFLKRARAQQPQLDIVVIGGNHDSPARLEAANPILSAFGIHVVGSLPRLPDRSIDYDRLVVPLHGQSGDIAAYCAAVPFLRSADLPSGVEPGPLDGEDTLIAGVRAVYSGALERMRTVAEPHHLLLAMGHAYMVGTSLSELSERRVLGGNQHALPADIFDDHLAYVALGHLHKAQRVGGRDTVRYSGSPIPLALDEDVYKHQVVVATLAADTPPELEILHAPRHIGIQRIPGREGGDWADVAPQLEALPAAATQPNPDRWPYLEVRVRVDGPRPTLRRDVESIIRGKAVRLVKLMAVRQGDGLALADHLGGQELSELGTHEVLTRKWLRDYGCAPPPDVLACFHELLDDIGQNAGGVQ